jgi:CTD kinase subunit gamma
MNTRANIMYFLEHLCELALRESHPEYIRMIQRDILRIIDAVCPIDGSGAANIRVVRRVLAALQAKSVLMPETVSELDVVLKEREGEAQAFVSGGVDDGDGGVVARKSGGARLERRQIEQRIEEDRERHKRLREGIWAVDHGADGDGELDKLWDEASDIGEDDYLAGKEDAEERRKSIAVG